MKNMISIPSKLPQVGTTIFSVMSQLAAEQQAVNLSQGFPDFGCDPQLTDLLNRYATGGFNQYAPMIGVQGLREQISAKYLTHYQSPYHPDTEVTITSGGSEAIFCTIASVIQPGDEVIVFEPAYDLYQPAIQLFGGVVKAIPLFPPLFQIDWQSVAAMTTGRTRLIIINNPNNPSTRLLDDADLCQLAALTRNTGILVLSDEVYEHIVYDQHRFRSVSMYPELKERSFVIASFGKLLHVTGWKVGYCVAPQSLMTEFRKVHQFNVFSVHTPSQLAIAGYLEKNEVYEELKDFFQRKRDRFIRAMQGSRFRLLESQGSYFINADYSRISEIADIDFAQWITREHKVAAIPVSVFYSQKDQVKLLRFCFAKKDETLDRAAELLHRIS